LRITGTDLTIWGTGSPLRQFIFSEDLARLTVSRVCVAVCRRRTLHLHLLPERPCICASSFL
jgi:hypothetical protein